MGRCKPGYYSAFVNNYVPSPLGEALGKFSTNPKISFEVANALSLKSMRKAYRRQRALRTRHFTARDYGRIL